MPKTAHEHRALDLCGLGLDFEAEMKQENKAKTTPFRIARPYISKPTVWESVRIRFDSERIQTLFLTGTVALKGG